MAQYRLHSPIRFCNFCPVSIDRLVKVASYLLPSSFDGIFCSPRNFFCRKVICANTIRTEESAAGILHHFKELERRVGTAGFLQAIPYLCQLGQPRRANPTYIAVSGHSTSWLLIPRYRCHTPPRLIPTAQVEQGSLNVSVEVGQHIGLRKICQIDVFEVVVQTPAHKFTVTRFVQ